MSSPDAVPAIHQPLESQLAIARLELDNIASSLWQVVGYDRDAIAEALRVFPAPAQRRSDTVFTCAPEDETSFRTKAALLGPGRADTETLEDLGVYQVDVEAVEPGQLHKTATELWKALQSGNQAPILVFGSDRTIPLWAKDAEKQDIEGKVDAERLSTDRLLWIGGRGLAGSAEFFYRAGQFDTEAKFRQDDEAYLAERTARALALPSTEYDVHEKFLGSMLDTVTDNILPIAFDPATGEVGADMSGQVRRLGTVSGRDVILLHKEKAADGSTLDPTHTILMLGRVSALLTRTSKTVMSYWTSATYKPSRWMSGIRAGILASQTGEIIRVAVPTYGYEDLSAVKGETAAPPTVQNIAGEMGKAAQEASELRDFLNSVQS